MKIGKIIFWLVVVLGLGSSLILSIGTHQLSPHYVKTTLGTTVISSNLVTDPVYTTFDEVVTVTSNGFQIKRVPVQREYWKIWAIFK